MERAAIERAADMLWRARLQGRRLAALPADCRPATLAEGYRVQDCMAARTGQRVAG